jgi:hypothetical protein
MAGHGGLRASTWLLAVSAISLMSPLAAQDTIFVGTVTNLGYDGRGQGLTGSALLTARWERDTTPTIYLHIGAPLGGSGDAYLRGWSDTLLIRTISPTADTIAWLGWRTGTDILDARLVGSYHIYGGQYRGQGGRWEAALGSIGRRYLADRLDSPRPADLADADFVRLFAQFLQSSAQDQP